MELVLDILRRGSAEEEPWHQKVVYSTDDERETVATALRKINDSGNYIDTQGRTVSKIRWEESCGQKKCGACAMLINGDAALACDTFLRNMKDGALITLAPLSKFPVVADLICDRSIMAENLKTLKVWSKETGEIKEKNLDMAFDGAMCLQCGCCLEACPNFYPEGKFFSAAAFAPQGRLISSLSSTEKKELRKTYSTHIYEGCAKSLACQKVCPAGLDLDRILSRSNAIEIWRRK